MTKNNTNFITLMINQNCLNLHFSVYLCSVVVIYPTWPTSQLVNSIEMKKKGVINKPFKLIRCSETWPESNNLDNCFVGYPCKELFFSSLPRFPIMFVYFDLTLKNVVEIVNVLIVYGFLKKELLRQHQCALIIMELICKSDNPLVDRLKNFKNPIDFCFWGNPATTQIMHI